MLEKLSGNYEKLAVWLVALVCVSVLVGLGKAKPEMIEIVLSYLAGAFIKSKADAATAKPPEAKE